MAAEAIFAKSQLFRGWYLFQMRFDVKQIPRNHFGWQNKCQMPLEIIRGLNQSVCGNTILRWGGSYLSSMPSDRE